MQIVECRESKKRLLAERPFALSGCSDLLLGVGEALVDFVPVDDVPPGGEVVGAAVVVLEVVGVLPDVVAEDGVEAVGEGGVLVGLGDDFELAALVDEEAPAGAELLGGGFVEELLEVGEAAEVLGDLVGDIACRDRRRPWAS